MFGLFVVVYICSITVTSAFVVFFQRPFACPLDGCHCCYRRKDHLTRHILTHEGKIFVCPVENCGKKFNVQGNMKRHAEEMHGDDIPLVQEKVQQHICSEFGCGKVFKYASKLRKHEDSHGECFLRMLL